jgi:MFS family permease
MVFFLVGLTLYATIPWTASASGSLALFVGFLCIILSMYGGGFATVPAYLADLFGDKMVSAIHGRLLTAWSTAGMLGPVLVNYAALEPVRDLTTSINVVGSVSSTNASPVRAPKMCASWLIWPRFIREEYQLKAR